MCTGNQCSIQCKKSDMKARKLLTELWPEKGASNQTTSLIHGDIDVKMWTIYKVWSSWT